MKDVNTGYANITGFLLTLFSLVLFASVVQARDVTFTWTANTEAVDGYRLYYKTGTTGGAPYDGTGAIQGNSPVDTGNVTTFTLQGLSDSETYYFVLTAVTGTLESDYSTELTLDALPSQSQPGVTATFSWLPNQETNLAGYKIYYGTASRTYDTTIDIGNPAPVNGRIQGRVDGLIDGTTYYFAATAYDTSNQESDYSTEVVWTASSQSGGGNPPTAANSSLTTPEDQALSGTAAATNDSGLPITYLVQQDVTNGTLFMETGTGHFTYTPMQNFAGTDAFTFLARDGNGDSNIATVSITVTAVNDLPTAQNAAFSVSEDSTAGGQLQALDADNDSLTYSVVAGPTRGSVDVNSATGVYTYTPYANASGSDSFTFRVSDGQVTSNTATVSITITATNDPPTAQSAQITVSEDSSTNGQLQAQDPDGNSLTYSTVAGPTRGSLTLNATGAFTYTPNADISGTDGFTFRVSDGQTTSNTATVSITISPVNDVPVAANGSLTAAFDQTASGTLQATDQENDPLTFSIASDPQQIVTLTNATTGSYTITPVTGMTSPYTFTFRVNDGTADSNTATVTVTLIEEGTITEIFGDTPDSNHLGTLADTFTNLNNDNNDAAQQIITYSWSSSTPHKPANTIIIKPDLSALPENILITEAKLFLYQTDANGEATYVNSVHKITGKNPIIDQVTGYNAFNGEPWTPVATGTTDNDVPLGLADIAPAEDTITLDSQTGYRTWTITGMVKDWVGNPAGNFGLLITGVPTNSETGRIFASTENQNGSIRPKLIISYIKKPPKPSIMSVRKIK